MASSKGFSILSAAAEYWVSRSESNEAESMKSGMLLERMNGTKTVKEERM